MIGYYKPKNKEELTRWLVKRYSYAQKDFKKMLVAQKWAIYYRCIENHEAGITI